MNFEDCCKKLKIYYDKIVKLGKDYNTKVENCLSKYDKQLLTLENNYNRELKSIEDEYFRKKCELCDRYKANELKIKEEQKLDLVNIETEYQNKRCDAECDIAALAHIMSNEDVMKLVANIPIENIGEKENLDNKVINLTKTEEKKTVVTEYHGKVFRDKPSELSTSASTTKIIDQESQNNKYGFTKSAGNVGSVLNKNVEPAKPINENARENISNRITPKMVNEFLNIIHGESWNSKCEHLKLNSDATAALSKTKREQWDEKNISTPMFLIKGRNTNGGGYISLKVENGDETLVAPSPMAIFNDKIIVSNGYLYYFKIIGSYGANAKVNVTKPAIIKCIDDCYQLVKKGVLELS